MVVHSSDVHGVVFRNQGMRHNSVKHFLLAMSIELHYNKSLE